MRSEETKLIELGSVSGDTRGGVMGIADSEFGKMWRPSLHDD